MYVSHPVKIKRVGVREPCRIATAMAVVVGGEGEELKELEVVGEVRCGGWGGKKRAEER